jgi:hypothetical protein
MGVLEKALEDMAKSWAALGARGETFISSVRVSSLVQNQTTNQSA